MAAKEWAHVEMLIEGTKVFDLMKFCEGKILAGSLQIRPVRHGGADEAGAPKPRPTGREIIMALATSQGQFTMKGAVEVGAERGVLKQTIYSAVHKMKSEKALKRVAPATYALAASKKGNGRATEATK